MCRNDVLEWGKAMSWWRRWGWGLKQAAALNVIYIRHDSHTQHRHHGQEGVIGWRAREAISTIE